MTVGVVAERRESRHGWADATWRPVAVISSGGPSGSPRMLEETAGVSRWYIGRADVQLYGSETDGYLHNLQAATPRVYVVVRPRERGDGIEPFLATACPYEAQAYLDSEEIVEGVAMPPDVAEWVRAFVERHHVAEPFVKRKQKPKRTSVDSDPFRREPPVMRSRREKRFVP